jgi:hypothetical protein
MIRLPRTFAAVTLGAALLAACSKPAPVAHSYPDWNFAVSLAGPVKETPTKANGAQPASFLVTASADGHDYAVNVIDASSATVSPDQLLSSAPQAVASSMEVDLGTTTDVTASGVNGRQVLFTKDDKPAMIDRFFVAGGKLYEVSATVPAGAADPAAKAFLDSFHLITPPPPPAPAPAANATNAASNDATNAAATNAPG